MKRLFKTRFLLFSLVMLTLMGAFGYSLYQGSDGASASVEVVGNPDGATDRVLMAPAGGKVSRIQYFAAGSKTMSGANTVVPSDPVCSLGGYTLYRADFVLTGTMTGTAPTLAIKWQHSIDGGTNWTDVGTWTTVNATVTPASQSQTVSDIYNATTAVAYGDCWRATWVMGGTGTVTANFSVKGFAK